MRWMPLALVAGLAVAPGCNIYFGDDDDVTCHDDGPVAPPIADFLRDPYTGECVYGGGGGGGGGCIDRPHAAAEGDQAFPGAGPDWAQCYGYCESLDEWSCIATDSCRAIYDTTSEWGPQFRECWGVAPSGPVRGGTCSDYDAQECSRHDDCSAVFYANRFELCMIERGVCDGGGAPPPADGGLRNPETGKCEGGGGPGPCGLEPAGGQGDVPINPPDWATCTSYCTGLAETDCKATDGCRAIFWNKYPPNVDAFELEYKECWATAPSGPVRGGNCASFDAQECSRHDDCVANHDSDWFDCTSPGGCPPEVGGWLSCGPEADVPPPPPPAPKCDQIVDEDTCIDMVDGCLTNADGSQSCGEKCSPIYEGEDCVCDPSGCVCQSWVFTDCVY